MKIDRTIAVAAIAAVGTLALSAGPAFAAVGGNAGNPRDFQPSFTIESKSGMTFSIPKGDLPANEQFIFMNTVRPLGSIAWQKAWAGGPAVHLKGAVVWQVGLLSRYVPHLVKHPVKK